MSIIYCFWQNISTFIFPCLRSDYSQSFQIKSQSEVFSGISDDESDSGKINSTSLDTDLMQSSNDGSVSDKNSLKTSSSEYNFHGSNTNLSTYIRIRNEKISYIDALRSLYVENAADDYKEQKFVYDLLRTQCRDSDLFQESSCCRIL